MLWRTIPMRCLRASCARPADGWGEAITRWSRLMGDPRWYARCRSARWDHRRPLRHEALPAAANDPDGW
jgi:hypothetical protein